MNKEPGVLTLLQSAVPEKYQNMFLLDYLFKRYPYRDPAGWQEAMAAKKLLLNHQFATGQEKLRKGDLVSYWVELQEPPVSKNIEILFEDPHIVVAVKPGNLPSHADGNFIKHTFIFLLKELLRERGYEGELWLCHRLDRETSGLMIVAKTKAALKYILDQFIAGTVKKEYRCVVQGTLGLDRFVVKEYIARDPDSVIGVRWAVVPENTPGAKASLTEFQVMERFADTTYLRAYPKTGRTNQIRVHLSFLYHPVVGDKLYGRTDQEFLEYIHHVKTGGDQAFGNRWGAGRQLLHAYSLTFKHPATQAMMNFTAALSQDMVEYLRLRNAECVI